MLVESKALKDWIVERKQWLSQFWFAEYAIRELDIVLSKIEEMEKAQDAERIDTFIYDQEEVYDNCTVQILTNTVTGEVSVGWWEN